MIINFLLKIAIDRINCKEKISNSFSVESINTREKVLITFQLIHIGR